MPPTGVARPIRAGDPSDPAPTRSTTALGTAPGHPPAGRTLPRYQPVSVPVAPASAPTGFPAPGTDQWFAPPPPPPAPAAAGSRVGPAAIATALTPAVIICLVIGGIVWPLAPITFALAAALTVRMRAGRSLTRILFGVGLALLGFVLLVGILLGDGVFGDWWELLSRWAQALSWIMLVVGVDRGLSRPAHAGAVPDLGRATGGSHS